MSIKSLFLIFFQFLFIAYLTYTGVVTLTPYLVCFQFFGIAIALWGVLTIRIGNFNIQPEVKSSRLVVSGPYKYIRNPMYLGLLCVFTPAVVAYPNAIRWLALGCLVAVLLLKIVREEYFLSLRFGKEYTMYVAKTKRLIPYIF